MLNVYMREHREDRFDFEYKVQVKEQKGSIYHIVCGSMVERSLGM